jgi:hypothetical protein
MSGLAPNSTYYLWVQRPTNATTNVIDVGIKGGPSAEAFQLGITQADLPGTYLVSLSTSNAVDTRVAVVHFGVFGTDKDTYQRTENILASGGGVFPNSTVSLTITYQNATPTTVSANASSFGNFQYAFSIPANAPIGEISISASGRSFESNKTATVSVQTSDTVASISFLGQVPPSVQRTSTAVFNFTLAYPNGTLLTPTLLVSNPNLTITLLGVSNNFLLNYSNVTRSWHYSYPIGVNATLGAYSYSLEAEDLFGNPAVSSGTFDVDLAKFIIVIPQVPQLPAKAKPEQVIQIAIFVWYPNLTSLTGTEGNVTTLIKDTNGNNVTLPLYFNATDGMWHLAFTTPSLGYNFGTILTFSFNAVDIYHNSGASNNAYVLTVGASPEEVILAGIAGSVIPIVLLIWALATISKRRRKHKP